jgi:hypothetical protein
VTEKQLAKEMKASADTGTHGKGVAMAGST